MKHGKKYSLILLLAALVIGVFPVSAQAANREYMIRVSAGNKGTIPSYENALYSVTLPYGSNLPVPDAIPVDGYYVKGIKESGKDSFMNGYYITQDQDFIIVYGIKGHEVSYVVRYLEYGTDTVLAQEQTFYADPGDKPVSSYIYIEGYQPYRRTTKTLVEDASQNVLFAYYTKLPAETTAAAGGGGGAAAGGGGAAAAGGGAAAGGNAGNANANAGNANANANAGNANADNNANANANADNANANANADNTGGATAAESAAAAQQAQQPAQQSYAQLEDIMDLDVPLASFEDLVGSTGSSGSSASSEPSIESGSPAVIEENTKPKGMTKGLLIFFVILFFCLVALLYWYLLFYRKKKKYADVEVVTFADDDEEDDDFDIEEFRRRHRKKDE